MCWSQLWRGHKVNSGIGSYTPCFSCILHPGAWTWLLKPPSPAVHPCYTLPPSLHPAPWCMGLTTEASLPCSAPLLHPPSLLASCTLVHGPDYWSLPPLHPCSTLPPSLHPAPWCMVWLLKPPPPPLLNWFYKERRIIHPSCWLPGATSHNASGVQAVELNLWLFS